MTKMPSATMAPSMFDDMPQCAPTGDDDLEKRAVRARLRADLFGRSKPVRVGRFALLERIGSGAMGVVHAGFDDTLDRRVAIKLIGPHVAGTERARIRMLREAQALAKVSHPNVVQIYEAGMHEGQLFIAMEFVDGLTLIAWATEQRSWREIVDAYVQAGRGLAAAHRAGLIHRDFKPENAMIDADGVVRVMDFGLARTGRDLAVAPTLELSSEAFANDVTRTGALIGTPAYMAPEQFEGAEADSRTDQFALCVCLWEALHGTRPFDGESLEELKDAFARGKLVPPRRDTDVPVSITKVLERGLSTDPDDRWESIDALLAALDPKPPRRSRFVLGLGLTALGAIAGAGVAASTVSDPEPPPARIEVALPELAAKVPMDEVITQETVDASATTPPPVVPEFKEVARSIGRPHDGRLEGAVQLPELPELYMSVNRRQQWGTAYTVEHLVAAIRQFRASTGFSHPIVIAEISGKRGGKIPPHKTHQSGRDVDIHFIARRGVKLNSPSGTPPNQVDIDYFATFQLVRSLTAAPGVKHIYISESAQTRLGDAAIAQGVARAEVERLFDPAAGEPRMILDIGGHERGLHVRFHCGPNQPDCIE